MIPSSFAYHRAESVEQALSLMETYGPDAKLMAGGHSLLPSMKLRLSTPANLIDISRVAELKGIGIEGDTLVIGGGTTHREIETSAEVAQTWPLLAQAASLIGDPAVRNMGTIGGSLAHADPAADWPASLIATGASLVLRSATGQREVPVEEFFIGLYMTTLEEGELITQIRIPTQVPGTGRVVSAYEKFMQPASRFAIVGCAAVLRLDRGNACTYARVGFTGVADAPFRDEALEQALLNQLLDEQVVAAAAEQAAQDADALGDHFASEAYRLHLARVYAKRAVLKAMAS